MKSTDERLPAPFVRFTVAVFDPCLPHPMLTLERHHAWNVGRPRSQQRQQHARACASSTSSPISMPNRTRDLTSQIARPPQTLASCWGPGPSLPATHPKWSPLFGAHVHIIASLAWRRSTTSIACASHGRRAQHCLCCPIGRLSAARARGVRAAGCGRTAKTRSTKRVVRSARGWGSGKRAYGKRRFEAESEACYREARIRVAALAVC